MVDQDYDRKKVDEIVLALLYLSLHRDNGRWKAMKTLDRSALDRLYEKGVIQDPTARTREIILTEDGRKLAEEFFAKHFVQS